jgi:hypothetical protein
LSQIDINKKYNSFLEPKNQIIVNNEEILEKFSIQTSEVTIEEAIGVLPQFYFVVNDLRLLGKNTGLFDLNKNVTIKMGYANTLDTVLEGEITTVKTIFPSNELPHIEVSGVAKSPVKAIQTTNNKPILTLIYGRTLYCFIFITNNLEQKSESKSLEEASAIKAPKRYLSCSGECVGLPELKAQILISIDGVGKTFDGNYYVEKVTHKFENGNYTTRFEATKPKKRILYHRKSKWIRNRCE